MKKDTRVTIQCPSFRRGKKFEGIITGEKTLAALHIAKHGRTYFVKLDGNNKSTQFHESWLAKLPAPSTPVKDAGQSDKQEQINNVSVEMLIEALNPFAEMCREFTSTKIRQGGTVFQYNDKHLKVADFEKAEQVINYLSHHPIK